MENNEIMAQQQAKDLSLVEQTTAIATNSVWENKDSFNQLLRAAQMLSQTSIIPQSYQNKPQDCFVAIEMANRMGVSPMVVMQNMYVVKGKPSWAGQACTMLINSCGKFKDVKHIYTGEKGKPNRGCYVTATRISDGSQVDGVEVTMQMAQSEGWTSNSKWRNMPELMLAYRASAFFARVYCPEAMMGVQTAEEVYDADSTPINAAASLTAALKGETEE